MAIAVNGGHISRALDFYNAVGKYFIIGGTTAWEDETAPPAPTLADFKLVNVVGLKKVDNTHLVIPSESGTIAYRDQNWKIVPASTYTTLSGSVSAGESVLPVVSLEGITEGAKLRINDLYEGIVTNITGLNVTIGTPAPANIPSGSPVRGGALIEGAKYVYVDCYLNYDEFPIVTYRQLGLCTGVTPASADILRAAPYAVGSSNEFTSLGVLEILDNRIPATRDDSQRELISLIVEF